MTEHLFTHIMHDAMKEHVGKEVPVTIEVNGEKQVIGKAVIVETERGLELKSEIDEGYAGLFRDRAETFSFRTESE